MRPDTQRNLYWLLLAVGVFPFLINGYVNSVIADKPVLYWSFEVLSWVVLPVVVFAIAVRKGGMHFSDIGLHGTIFGRKNLALLAMICVLFAPLDLIVYRKLAEFFFAVLPSDPWFGYDEIVPEDPFARKLVAAYFGLTAGIVEEMYYRGLMHRIARFYARPNVVYLIASPLLFASVHWEGGIAKLAATYFFGLFVALAFLWLKNLWPLIVGHVVTDYAWFN